MLPQTESKRCCRVPATMAAPEWGGRRKENFKGVSSSFIPRLRGSLGTRLVLAVGAPLTGSSELGMA